MARRRGGWAVVAWAPYSRRSEMFARELGGTLHTIHYLRFQSPPYAPFKYPLQAAKTLHVLFRDRPVAVHVQNPPFVCGLVVDLYCRITGARFVTEFHSAAFLDVWRWARPFQRYLARRAAANIVTSEHWASVVQGWGGTTITMLDPFLDLPEGRPYPLGDGFNVAFISTFAQDEPVEEVLAAAALMPDVHFLITGDPRKRAERRLPPAPPNVSYTGFLDPAGEYLGLLRGVDAALVLTTRDHTLQLAGCEAVGVGTPVITSDWAYLRQLFYGGAVFVSNDASGIAGGVKEMILRRHELAEELDVFRTQSRIEWAARMEELRRRAMPSLPGRSRGDVPGSAPPRTRSTQMEGA
jgi:glycosyltransferase involved in cell wall biosynthesis